MSTPADYPDFATPQAHATAISITGVPLLTLAGTLLTSQVFNIPAGGNLNSAVLPITQLGYEISLACSIPVAATIPFIDVDMVWTDPTGMITVAQEKWSLPCASTGTQTQIGSGPTKGAQLQLKFTNQDPAQIATVTAVVLSNSRVYSRDRWIPNGLANIPTFIGPAGDPRRETLALVDALSVGAGLTATRLLPPYHGDVMLYIDQFGNNAANSTASLSLAPSGALGSAALWSGQPNGGVGLGITTILRLPRACTLFKYVNSGGVAAIVNLRVVMLDNRL
jgi:hypothetical protein